MKDRLILAEDEVYHAFKKSGWQKDNHKYIKREWKAGKWRYTYPDNVKENKQVTNDKSNQLKKLTENTRYRIESLAKNNTESKIETKTDWFEAAKKWVSNMMDNIDTNIEKTAEIGKNWLKNKSDELKTLKGLTVTDVIRNTTEKANELINETWHIFNPVKPDLKFSDLKRKTTICTPDEDMAAVNPNYQLDEYHDQNCAMCSFAYELRRRGYDVEAVKEDTANNLFEGGGLMPYQIYKLYEDVPEENRYDYNWLVQKSYSKERNMETLNDFANEMVKFGNGARGEIHVVWAGFGSGHSMAWEVENGKLIIRDAQTNETVSLEALSGRIRCFGSLRTDNLVITDAALAYVKNREDK